MATETAVGAVLGAASSQGPIVLIATLFGLFALALVIIVLAFVYKWSRLHSGQQEKLTSAILKLSEDYGKLQTRSDDAVRESSDLCGKLEHFLSRISANSKSNGMAL